MFRELLYLACCVFVVGLASGKALAGVDYQDPAGGWTYIYTGDAGGASLDGTWDHDNGSDQYDGTTIGSGSPGGCSILTDGNTTYLRLQETGDPTDHAMGDPSNRKIMWTHDIGADLGADPGTILDDGVTISFRARISTGAPLDDLHGDGGSPTGPWPAGGNGYVTHNGGKGSLGIRQSADMAGDEEGEPKIAGRTGLCMNNQNGTSPSGTVDIQGNEAGTLNLLDIADPTQWHEFWIQIVADTSQNSTHKVTVWMDGNAGAPDGEFWVTAGNDQDEDYSYFEMGLGSTDQHGAIDVDFHAYKPDLHEPVAAYPPEKARDPNPVDGESDAPYKIVLSWTPGDYVTGLSPKHRIYFSDDFSDVNDGAADVTTQDADYYPVSGSLVLDFSETYYWRVDEANSVIGWDLGDVWQFTVEPIGYPIPNTSIIAATASSSYNVDSGPENTVNGSGLDDNDLHSTEEGSAWLSSSAGPQPTWIQYEFDKVYKLHEMWVWNFNLIYEPLVGFGLRDVEIKYSTNGTDWTVLEGVPEFARAPGLDGYEHDTTVNFGGAVAKYVKLTVNSNWGGLSQYGLSEVRFFYIPVWAREPSPRDGAANVGPDVVLSWRAGRDAASHDLYFGANEQAVVNGTVPVINLSEASYDAGTLRLDETYYWQVNEANEAATPAIWEGDLWYFTTPEYLVVDDMESYGDANTPGEPGSRIWYTWRDGSGWTNPSVVEGNGTGSTIGNWPPPIAETGTVHEGGQSLPYYYNNSGANDKARYSEARASIDDLAIGRDWTKGGAKALTLWFYGDPDNAAGATEQMYLKLNGAKLPYDGDMTDITEESWHAWNIDLADFGVSLTNVTEIAIGFGDEANTISGGSGVVYFDDIRLYPSRCILWRRSADFAKVDYVEDCVVNHKELAMMMEDWLFSAVAPSSANLVVHYEFEGNLSDSSSYTGYHHGSPGGEVGYEAGVLGQAISLDRTDDSNDYVDCGNPAVLNFGTVDWSICAWVKTTQTGDTATVFANGGDNAGGIRYTLGIGEGGPDGVVTLTTDDDVDKVQAISSATVNDDRWHHVAGLRDGTTLAVYVDGMLEDTATLPDGYDLSGAVQHNAYVGAITDHVDATGQTLEKYFVGLIDDLRIYDYALSGAEIVYLAGSAADLSDDKHIDLRDYAILANEWLDEQLWP